MPKISWNLWKLSFPYKCGECGHIHNMYRGICEGCGKEKTLIKTTKSDYKGWKHDSK